MQCRIAAVQIQIYDQMNAFKSNNNNNNNNNEDDGDP